VASGAGAPRWGLECRRNWALTAACGGARGDRLALAARRSGPGAFAVVPLPMGEAMLVEGLTVWPAERLDQVEALASADRQAVCAVAASIRPSDAPELADVRGQGTERLESRGGTHLLAGGPAWKRQDELEASCWLLPPVTRAKPEADRCIPVGGLLRPHGHWLGNGRSARHKRVSSPDRRRVDFPGGELYTGNTGAVPR